MQNPVNEFLGNIPLPPSLLDNDAVNQLRESCEENIINNLSKEAKSVWAVMQNEVFGGSIWTYPIASDENQRKIYQGCQELEKIGLATSDWLGDDVKVFRLI